MQLLALWPLPVSLAAFLLNVEFVVMPWLILHGILDGRFYLISIACGTIEVCWWYWCFGWFGRTAARWDVVQSAKKRFGDRGMFVAVGVLQERMRESATWILGELYDFVQNHTTPRRRWQQRFLTASLTAVRTSPTWAGYVVIFGVGAAPVGWIIGIPLCRATKLPYDFAVFLFGNAAKIVYMGAGVLLALEQFRILS